MKKILVAALAAVVIIAIAAIVCQTGDTAAKVCKAREYPSDVFGCADNDFGVGFVAKAAAGTADVPDVFYDPAGGKLRACGGIAGPGASPCPEMLEMSAAKCTQPIACG